MTSWWIDIPQIWSTDTHTTRHVRHAVLKYPFQTAAVGQISGSGATRVNPLHNTALTTWGLCAYVQVETPHTCHPPRGSILVTVGVPIRVPARVLARVPCAVHSGVTVIGDKTM